MVAIAFLRKFSIQGFLLQRLYHLGVCESEIAWFSHQLGQWSIFRVSMVDGGIPQRSILGLLLILVYVNQMPLQVSHGYNMLMIEL